MGTERSAAILAAFERSLIAKGFDNASLTEIAQKARLPHSLRNIEWRGKFTNVYANVIDRAPAAPGAEASQLACAAVSLAFGPAFFRYMGFSPTIGGSHENTVCARFTGTMAETAHAHFYA